MNLKRAVKVFFELFISVEVTFTNYTAMPAKVTRLTEQAIIKKTLIVELKIWIPN